MKEEYTAEDFALAVKNPYFDKYNKKVEVAVSNIDYEYFEKLSSEGGMPVRFILRQAVKHYAKILREAE